MVDQQLKLKCADISIDTPLEESIPALDEIRKAGKTRYIGLSECSAATLRKANSSKADIPICRIR